MQGEGGAGRGGAGGSHSVCMLLMRPLLIAVGCVPALPVGACRTAPPAASSTSKAGAVQSPSPAAEEGKVVVGGELSRQFNK